MKTRIMIVALLLPASLANADFERVLGANSVMEVKGEQVSFVKQPSLVGRIYRFCMRKGVQHENSVVFATEVSKSCYPATLVGIAAVESEFDPKAVGDGGDSVGAFQVQPKHWGEVSEHLEEQIRQADQIFTALVKQYGYKEAVARWNGKGKQARKYRSKVLNNVRCV